MTRILFFIESLTGGGAEKVLCDLVNHMDQTKFDITVQTVWSCDPSRYLVPGIRYKSMYSSCSKANRLRYRLEAETGLAYRLRIKDDYDIECAYLEMGPTKVMAASTNKKAKKLVWVHCDLTKAVDDPLGLAKKTSSWYECFDEVVCVSKGVKASFDELFGRRFNTVVLNNVIDDEMILKSSRIDPEDFEHGDEPVVMAVGRLSVPKNYYRLLSAHERLIHEGIQHQLWIIGEGPERAGLERFVKEHGVFDTVRMPGFRDNPYAYMSRADIIACSSSYEGFSTVAVEAVVLGKPFITTECFGMREILGDSEFGLIVDNNDEAFYQGLKRMLTDSNLRERYSQAASIRGREFSADVLTEKTERFFEELMIP